MRLNQTIPRVTAINTGANADKVAIPGDAAIVTSSPLTTAALGAYSLTLNSPEIDPKGDGSTMVLVSVRLGTATQGQLDVGNEPTSMGQVVITVQNRDPALALNGTIVVSALIVN